MSTPQANPTQPDDPPGWPLADPEILEALQQAFVDGSWGRYHGPFCQKLDRFISEYHQVEHVHLCGSGTFAVELALRALQVGAGDEVVLASYDFPGNILTVLSLGATPVLADVGRDHWNLSVTAVAEALGPRTKAVLASHLHGGQVPMRELMAVAKEKGIFVVEDACQAPGAMVQGERAGTWGDVGVWSFGGSKLLTAGRGGAIFTRDAQIAQRARTLQFRGNLVCPLSELQAAVLLPQCRKLDARNQVRWANVRQLCLKLAGVPGLRPFAFPESFPAFYKVGFQFDGSAFGMSRTHFVAAMRSEGIAMDVGFGSGHVGRSPRRFRMGSPLVESERAHHGSVILHHPVLLGSDTDIQKVADAVHKIAKSNS